MTRSPDGGDAGRTRVARSPRLFGVLLICFLTVIFDGYDIIVYGSVLPGLLHEPGWHLGTAEAGAIGSYALVGMLFGALVSGPLADRIGRRRLILAAVTWFTVFTVLTAFAPSVTVFGLLRLLTGLGLGGVLPSAVAFTVEFAPPGRRQMFNGLMSIGFPLGGILAAVLGLVLLAPFGWRSMFLAGAAPAVLILPFAFAFLPESPAYLYAHGRIDEAKRTARRFGLVLADTETDSGREATGLRSVLSRRHFRATVVFGLASLCALLLTYGLNTWLPQIMQQSGYALGSSLRFLLALNLGSIVLSTIAAIAADRFGPKIAVLAAFVAAGLSLLLLGLRVAPGLLVLAVAVAGLGGTGTQALIHGYVAAHYSPGARGSALGVVLATGRIGAILGPIVGGLILASGAALGWNFVVFALPALLGAGLIACGPRTAGRPRPPAPGPAAEPPREAASPHSGNG
ncbi:aromatic acid/H+ symport family MFS transporter [Amycolatopsis ultiminotia]|uniref:Aromatic acid/H+ symport family MFS transporter n=1 Tax=Amycolatopsis ultiminotia TaxID=543629 RepID=A0ABP6W5W7_9PSEU